MWPHGEGKGGWGDWPASGTARGAESGPGAPPGARIRLRARPRAVPAAASLFQGRCVPGPWPSWIEGPSGGAGWGGGAGSRTAHHVARGPGYPPPPAAGGAGGARGAGNPARPEQVTDGEASGPGSALAGIRTLNLWASSGGSPRPAARLPGIRGRSWPRLAAWALSDLSGCGSERGRSADPSPVVAHRAGQGSARGPPGSPPPRNHLSETYQIPIFRQEKKCFIYKPIRVFADNCECQILGRDDKVQRLPGPERLRGGGAGGAPGPPRPARREGAPGGCTRPCPRPVPPPRPHPQPLPGANPWAHSLRPHSRRGRGSTRPAPPLAGTHTPGSLHTRAGRLDLSGRRLARRSAGGAPRYLPELSQPPPPLLQTP